MPGVTPVWGIRYPIYSDGVIDPAAFKNFADDVDAAMDAIQAAGSAAATGRPSVILSRPDGPDTLANNVEQDVVWTTQKSGNDPAGWWTSGASIILPKGLYHVIFEYESQSTFVTTATASRGRVKVNGTFKLGRQQAPFSGATIVEDGSVSGVVHVTTNGHALVATYKWNGTGTAPPHPACEINVTQLVALP